MYKHPTLVIHFQPSLTKDQKYPDSILQTKFTKKQESSIL